MRCSNCATENPPQARFCLHCGARLTLLCPQCQTELPPDARFCLSCGAPMAIPQSPPSTAADLLKRLAPREYVERLLATRGQTHDERRTVTILFADVKGSTAMVEKLDPEDVKEIMHGAFEVLIAPIFRYEGTVVQLMGDAILAFFGAPIAHEDDPERACRAGLDITAAASEYAEKLKGERGIEGFAVRVGINTGLAVVGEVGTDLRVAYTAMGDAINLAARMEQNAEPGTVLITANTLKLVAPLFEMQGLAPLQLKGKAEPVQAYRVLAARSAAGKVRGIAGLQSPLVGRDAECAALSEVLACLRSGVGGVVTLVGEAGLGKSRLVAEMRKHSCAVASPSSGAAISLSPEQGRVAEGTARNDTGTPLQWFEGRCLSYGTSIAYLLWLDVLRNLLGVTVDDAPPQVIDRLRERTSALCGESADRQFPYLARLLSLPLDAETDARLRDEDGQSIKSHTFEAVEALLHCAANRGPLVLVCEDLHWADPTSLELLERVLALTDRTSLLLICVFRPDPAHGSWQLRETIRRSYRHRHTDLELRPLTIADSRTLVGNLLQVEDLPADLRQRIIAAAEGNPFFVEEVIRALVDSGAISRDATGRWQATRDVAEIVIPDTLQGVLLARLDRLQEDTRRVLQLASVIGRVFLHRVLAAIAAEQRDLDGHLLTLQRQEMIRERARLPELEYIFKHELTREAAYNGILKAERQAFHRQVAEALERLFPDRVDEQLGLLAHHWERAGDAQKATDYLLRAGDQARLTYAHPEAVDYYRRALAFMKGAANPEPAARTWMKLGQTYHSAFDFEKARQAYNEAFALRQRSAGDRAVSAPPRPPAPQPFRLAWWGGLPDKLDPGMVASVGTTDIIGQLFSGLVQLTAELDVVPDVAQSWEVLEGGSKYAFHLRDEAQWSDGTPLTAMDFEYAWKRILNPSTKSANASLLYDLRNARAFHQGQVSDPALVGVRVVDARTLVVELEAPAGYLLSLLACSATYPVPRHAIEAHVATWADAEHLISNGPFVLQAFQPGEVMAMVRNPRYHGHFSGNLQRVEWTVLSIADGSVPAVLAEMYDADHLDALLIGVEEEFERLRLRHPEDYVSAPLLGNDFLAFVVSRPPFDDVRVRRAFAMATDRRQLPHVARGRAVAASGGFVPEGMPGHSPGIALNFDPQGARALLAEAGYPLGHGFPVVELLGGVGWFRDLSENLQSQWRENLGVQTRWEARFPMAPALAERLRCANLHVFTNGWTADYPDPDNFLRVGLPLGLDWHHELYEHQIEAARRSTDQAERMRLYRQADRILVDEAPIVPLTYDRENVLVKPWVRLNFPPVGHTLYKDIIIEPHQQVAGQRATPVPSATRRPAPPAPHPFRRAWLGTPNTLDPGKADDEVSGAVIQQLFSGLLSLTPELDVEPDVARDWQVSESGRQYVFRLRDDVFWSDGVPVTAGDFEFAWKRVLDPRSRSAPMLYDIKNGRAFHQGKVTDAARVGVSAPDARTLLVELEGPTGYFLHLLACAATFPVPRHVVAVHGQAWTQPQNMVSNGAFLLRSMVPGDAMWLDRNPHYHGQRTGNVERVEFRLLPEDAWPLALSMYEAGQLDTIGVDWRLPHGIRQRLAADYVWGPSLQVSYLAFVVSQPPPDDGRLRRALAMAIDRNRLPMVTSGAASPATGGFVPPGMPGHSAGIALSYDPSAARRLLAEAGYGPGRGLPVLELLASPNRQDVAQSLRAQWAEALGVETRLGFPDPYYEGLRTRMRVAPPHMFLSGWVADYPDPDTFLRVGWPHETRWRDSAYERLVEDASRCMDQSERMRLYRHADRILVQEAAVVPLFYWKNERLLKPWVKMGLTRLGSPVFKDVILEPH